MDNLCGIDEQNDRQSSFTSMVFKYGIQPIGDLNRNKVYISKSLVTYIWWHTHHDWCNQYYGQWYLPSYFFFFFGDTGVLSQGLMLARQVLCYLSHILSPTIFLFCYRITIDTLIDIVQTAHNLFIPHK
jgi:hypothetical protein